MPARRTRPGDTPATLRAGSGTSGTSTPPPADRRPAAAAATAASACRAGAAGSSSARPAHSRNRDENSAVCGSVDTTSSSMSSGSTISASIGSSIGRLGQTDDDAVITPHRLDRDVVAVHQSALDRHRPRRVDGRPERAEDAHPPVADLVPEPLDHDRAIVGHGTGRFGLLVDVLHEVVGSERVERVVLHQPLVRRPVAVARGSRISRTNAPSARPSSSGRPGRSPCQNGILPG